MDIFRQYFYDINQFKRVPGNSSSYSSTTDLIEEKLSMFKNVGSIASLNFSFLIIL